MARLKGNPVYLAAFETAMLTGLFGIAVAIDALSTRSDSNAAQVKLTPPQELPPGNGSHHSPLAPTHKAIPLPAAVSEDPNVFVILLPKSSTQSPQEFHIIYETAAEADHSHESN